jgi:hypothetical protein
MTLLCFVHIFGSRLWFLSVFLSFELIFHSLNFYICTVASIAGLWDFLYLFYACLILLWSLTWDLIAPRVDGLVSFYTKFQLFLNFTIKCRNWNNLNPFNIRPQWQAIIKNRWLPQKKAGKKINQKILQISFSFLLCFCFNAEKVNAIWSNAEPKPSPDREDFLPSNLF